jgi:hypothetical protein
MTPKRKQAFVSWNGGICRVIDSADQTLVTKSIHFRRATRAARRRGYDVTVYKGEYAKAPRDATNVRGGGYLLPAVKEI